MAKIKPVKPGKAEDKAAETDEQNEPKAETEDRKTRGLVANTNESRQTRGLWPNANESLSRR